MERAQLGIGFPLWVSGWRRRDTHLHPSFPLDTNGQDVCSLSACSVSATKPFLKSLSLLHMRAHNGCALTRDHSSMQCNRKLSRSCCPS
jgi:hypothetical protein